MLAMLGAGVVEVAAARTMADVLAASKPTDWRVLDPANTLYMDVPGGRVVIELAPQFAPRHADNLRTLVREGYFDGQEINRVQDNFVVQWGGGHAAKGRTLRTARETLPGEFTRPAKGLKFTVLPDPDTYAPQTGFVDGFPAARDSATGTAWAVHCYGMVGVGRDIAADSGGGTELYAVLGHAPRQLDRNATPAGRVVQGMELLAALPRGRGELGIYDKPELNVKITRVRVAADVSASERMVLQVLRTDTPTFEALIESRRNRRDEWYKVPAGRIDVCNVPLPARVISTGATDGAGG
jgi:peptidylprolyl isomerase